MKPSSINPPPRPLPMKRAGRARLVGLTINEVFWATVGHPVTFVHPNEIGVRVGADGRAKAVW